MRPPTRLDIATCSFARCAGLHLLPPRERARLILASAHAFEPDLLVTGGGALASLAGLRRLSVQHARQHSATTIVTSVGTERAGGSDAEPSSSLWAIGPDGIPHCPGSPLFASPAALRAAPDEVRARFEAQHAGRTLEVDGLSVLALAGAEIGLVQGRTQPRFAFPEAEAAVLTADIVVHLLPERLANASALHGKRALLSRFSPAGHDRLYVSCSDWEVSRSDGRLQWPWPGVHAIYRSGERLAEEVIADGAFGFVYQRWAVELLGIAAIKHTNIVLTP